jgi:hypothetical protein
MSRRAAGTFEELGKNVAAKTRLNKLHLTRGLEEQRSSGAGEQRSRGAGEQRSRGQGSRQFVTRLGLQT